MAGPAKRRTGSDVNRSPWPAQLCAATEIHQIDRERMGRVLGNLLENVLRHTLSGGVITVRTDRTSEAVTITVSDTGEGIPQPTCRPTSSNASTAPTPAGKPTRTAGVWPDHQ